MSRRSEVQVAKFGAQAPMNEAGLDYEWPSGWLPMHVALMGGTICTSRCVRERAVHDLRVQLTHLSARCVAMQGIGAAGCNGGQDFQEAIWLQGTGYNWRGRQRRPGEIYISPFEIEVSKLSSRLLSLPIALIL